MSEFIHCDFVLPTAFGFLLGWLSSSAAKKWELCRVQDSVLRLCHLKGDWSAVSARMNFCSIVNGKASLIDVNGKELPGWKAELQRKLVLIMGTMFLVVAIAMIRASTPDNSIAEWALMEPLPVIAAWVYFTLRLRSQTLRTKLSLRSPTNANKWETIVIRAARAKDGMPTKKTGAEE